MGRSLLSEVFFSDEIANFPNHPLASLRASHPIPPPPPPPSRGRFIASGETSCQSGGWMELLGFQLFSLTDTGRMFLMLAQL